MHVICARLDDVRRYTTAGRHRIRIRDEAGSARDEQRRRDGQAVLMMRRGAQSTTRVTMGDRGLFSAWQTKEMESVFQEARSNSAQ